MRDSASRRDVNVNELERKDVVATLGLINEHGGKPDA